MIRSPARTVFSAATSCACTGTAPYVARKVAVAERVVEVLVGVDDADDIAGAEPAYVLDHGAGRLGRRVRVDDQQPAVAADEGDVQVEPLVPGHPHPVGDLDERSDARIAAYVGRVSEEASAEAGVQLAAQQVAELGDVLGRARERDHGRVGAGEVDPPDLDAAGLRLVRVTPTTSLIGVPAVVAPPGAARPGGSCSRARPSAGGSRG